MVALPDIELSYGTDMTEGYRVKRVSFGDGYSQRVSDGLNSKVQQWRLSYNGISNAEAETLRNFFRGLGGTGLIEWTPFNQSVELKWTANNFSCRPSSATTSDVTVTLQQEFDL